jgi:polyhydroxyalkanoate synthase
MYQKNLLAQPQGITLGGIALTLQEITTPIFMVSAKEDHIAPWKSTYAATRIFKNLQRFIVGESGHVAGIINPPSQQKYGYWDNSSFKEQPEEWIESATHHTGSWWTPWEQWLSGYGGQKISVKQVYKKPVPTLETAPGSYVTQK